MQHMFNTHIFFTSCLFHLRACTRACCVVYISQLCDAESFCIPSISTDLIPLFSFVSAGICNVQTVSAYYCTLNIRICLYACLATHFKCSRIYIGIFEWNYYIFSLMWCCLNGSVPAPLYTIHTYSTMYKAYRGTTSAHSSHIVTVLEKNTIKLNWSQGRIIAPSWISWQICSDGSKQKDKKRRKKESTSMASEAYHLSQYTVSLYHSLCFVNFP